MNKGTDEARTLNWYAGLILIAMAATVCNAVLVYHCIMSGNLVLVQNFSPSQLTNEAYSKPFTVQDTDDIIKISVSTSLNNAWMALDVAVVRSDDKVIHVYDSDLSYYHGVEGGESWSEGSRRDSAYVRIPQPGNYRLLVHAVSAGGNISDAATSSHGAEIQVKSGAVTPSFSIFAFIFSCIILLISFIAYSEWRKKMLKTDS
ncbi:hypothetical protein [Desulfonema magnum]|nr:hypothetical protein [Desulfonema magnum]